MGQISRLLSHAPRVAIPVDVVNVIKYSPGKRYNKRFSEMAVAVET